MVWLSWVLEHPAANIAVAAIVAAAVVVVVVATDAVHPRGGDRKYVHVSAKPNSIALSSKHTSGKI